MNVVTGNVYPSLNVALDAGEDPKDIVEVVGTPEQVKQVSEAVKAKHKAKQRRLAKNKRQKKARKTNRKS